MLDDVKRALEEVRGQLMSHGGDVEFVSLSEDGVVRVRLKGACHGCPGAMMTLKSGVERYLKSKVPAVKEVVNV